MPAILYRMPSGVPGDISRRAQSVVEQAFLDPAKPFTAYGLFGKVAAGKFVPLEANDAASKIYGVLARPYPTQTAAGDGTGVSTQRVGDALRSGFMTVKSNAGAPAFGGQVFTRVAAPVAGKPLGGVEALFETVVTSAAGANTGNGTIGTLSATVDALAGAFKVTMLTATTFSVVDPTGNRLKDGATGAAYSANGIGFTVTVGGVAFAANDSFTVTNAPSTVAVAKCSFKDAADASGNVEIEFNVA